VRQFYLDVNHNYKENGIPIVSTAEAEMVGKAIIRRLTKVCAGKRNYRLTTGVLVPAYQFKNQFDFYRPDKGKAEKSLLTDLFNKAYTEEDDFRHDLRCDRFVEIAEDLSVSYF
jgi:hypothetical protein